MKVGGIALISTATGLPGQSQCSSEYFFNQPANVSSCGYSCRTWAMFALKPFSRIQVNMSKNSFGIIILATKVGIGATQGLCPVTVLKVLIISPSSTRPRRAG